MRKGKVIMVKREHYRFEPNLTALVNAIRKEDWNQAKEILKEGMKLDKIEYYLLGRRMPLVLGLILDILTIPFIVITKMVRGERR